jgi:hypothetical protein
VHAPTRATAFNQPFNYAWGSHTAYLGVADFYERKVRRKDLEVNKLKKYGCTIIKRDDNVLNKLH